MRNSLLLLVLALILPTLGNGCVSKAQARAQARAAYLAGQQDTRQQINQNRGPVVTIIGQVRTPVLPWSADLTLAKALIAADYHGAEPNEIIVRRDGQELKIQPSSLLGGEDLPLEPRDVIEIIETTPFPRS